MDAGLPRDSRINAFASVGDALLAATDSGIFASTDEGKTWRPTSWTGRVLALVSAGRRSFAGTDGQGVVRSTDGGQTWSPIDGFPPTKVLSLLARGHKIYVGTDGDGVLVSADDGHDWTRMTPGFPVGAQVEGLATVGSRVFAALYSKGLYTWGDERWIKAGHVTPFALTATGNVLIAGHNSGGLFRSEDLGVSWTQGVADSIAQFPPVLADAPVWMLASEGDLLFAGVAAGIYYSEDRGATWTRARAGLPEKAPGIAFLLQPDFVLAAVTLK